MELRPYQLEAVTDAVEFATTAAPGSRRLYTAPTGTGKGTIQLEVQKQLHEQGIKCHIITPSREIADGYAERTGVTLPEDIDVYTRIKYRNLVVSGQIEPPAVLIVDELHHEVDGNVVTDHLAGFMPGTTWLGYTATGFRAVPKMTQKLWRDWGKPHVILTIGDAVRQGYMNLPDIELMPLVDDDLIEVTNGEFVIRKADGITKPRLEAIAEVCRDARGPAPLMLALPSTELVRVFCDNYAELVGVPCLPILQDTGYLERREIFELVEKQEAILVQINVVSEGVDLPWLRTLVDAKPTMSPVRWLQTMGRICRPHETQSRYICTNRNLERFAYLLDGMLPPAQIAAAQQAFDGPSTRSGNRAFGLETVGKFKALPFPCKDGLQGNLYFVTQTRAQESGSALIEQWGVIVLPHLADPLTVRRVYERSSLGEVKWNKWELANTPEDFCGYATVQRRYKQPTPRQLAWWRRSAGAYGLDNATDPDARGFEILPILNDIKLRIEA